MQEIIKKMIRKIKKKIKKIKAFIFLIFWIILIKIAGNNENN